MKWAFLALPALALLLAAPAGAQIDAAPKVHARLIAENREIAPGRTVTVALEENIRPGWHTYWRNPGDAGEPTEIHWTLPPGWRASPIAWPYPKELPVGPLMNYGYEGSPWLLVDIAAPRNAQPGTISLRAAASWLVCKDVCIPEDANLSLPLTVGEQSPPTDPGLARKFAAARELMPVASPWPAKFQLGNTLDLFVAAPKLADAGLADAKFFPFADDAIKGIAPQQFEITDNGVLLQLAAGKDARTIHELRGVVVLESKGAPPQALEVSALRGPVPEISLGESGLTLPLAVLFALLGGAILNLMPCVLPILAMKALAIASKSGRQSREAAHEGLAYGAGAVASFALLGSTVVALRAGGHAIGWGFQLQNPAVVAGFALLVFAIALNLSGVFEIPGIGAGEGLARRGGMLGAFFTGILAVAVAAPCTAPFMAAALGFALTQPASAALVVFVSLGIGFAAPFTAIGLSPALLRLLPKPGAWMNVFRQLLAFPMYGTALWLAWVLSFETDSGRVVLLLGAALALAFALWIIGAAQQSGRNWSRPLAAIALAGGVAALAVLLPLVNSGAPAHARIGTSVPSEPFSATRLAQLRAQNRATFVDATAAWCVTCLVNEKVALDDARVEAAFRDKHIAFLVADWTNRDPAVTALLSAHARSGVPMYLYYAPGAADAVVLPQILTPGGVLNAISHAG